MSGNYHEQLELAVTSLRTLRGEAQLLQLQRIVDLGHAHKDASVVVDALVELLQQAGSQDRLDYQLHALGQLQDRYQEGPAYAFARGKLLWYCKWVAHDLVEHAGISAEEIETFLEKMHALYRAEKEGLRPYWMLRCYTAWMMGRREDAHLHFQQWQDAQAGEGDDCPACELNHKIEYLLWDDQPAAAMTAAAPILEGKLSCSDVPTITFSRLIMAAVHLENLELAEILQQASVRHARSEAKMLPYLGRHVFYRSLTGRAEQTRRLAALTLGRAASSANDYARFHAFLGCAFWFAMLVREGITTVKLPRDIPPAGPSPNVDTPTGAAWCLDQARTIAQRFDRRNGNDDFSLRLDDVERVLRAIFEDKDEDRQS